MSDKIAAIRSRWAPVLDEPRPYDGSADIAVLLARIDELEAQHAAPTGVPKAGDATPTESWFSAKERILLRAAIEIGIFEGISFALSNLTKAGKSRLLKAGKSQPEVLISSEELEHIVSGILTRIDSALSKVR